MKTMLHATGYKRGGLGAASNTVSRQMPFLQEQFPEIENYHAATLNVRFEPRIIVVNADCRTTPIPWAGGTWTEVFDFVRVRLTFPTLSQEAAALMYIPHASPHRMDAHFHEFLVEKWIKGITENLPIEMHCSRPFTDLPYTATDERCRTNNMVRRARTLVIL